MVLQALFKQTVLHPKHFKYYLIVILEFGRRKRDRTALDGAILLFSKNQFPEARTHSFEIY